MDTTKLTSSILADDPSDLNALPRPCVSIQLHENRDTARPYVLSDLRPGSSATLRSDPKLVHDSAYRDREQHCAPSLILKTPEKHNPREIYSARSKSLVQVFDGDKDVPAVLFTCKLAVEIEQALVCGRKFGSAVASAEEPLEKLRQEEESILRAHNDTGRLSSESEDENVQSTNSLVTLDECVRVLNIKLARLAAIAKKKTQLPVTIDKVKQPCVLIPVQNTASSR
jgi:hypothetical protein